MGIQLLFFSKLSQHSLFGFRPQDDMMRQDDISEKVYALPVFPDLYLVRMKFEPQCAVQKISYPLKNHFKMLLVFVYN